MATDFSKPVVTDSYATLLPGIVTAFQDLARGLDPALTGTHTNVPVGAKRFNEASSTWERFNGTSWAAMSNLYSINISGNAATATKLATARTIGGVSFDGSANINLPGVNAPGNQPTTGNAATATKLATACTIEGVPFDGSANINLPSASETVAGKLRNSTSAENKAGAIQGVAVDPLGIREAFNASGSAPLFGVRAFASFDGAATSPAIFASGNISSITKNGVNDYTITFAVPMPDENYAIVFGGTQGANGRFLRVKETSASDSTPVLKTASQVRVWTQASYADVAQPCALAEFVVVR